MNKAELAAARNSPENKKRLAELIEAPENTKSAEASKVSKLFNPIALLSRTSEIHEVTHPQLGIIRFGELVLSDSEIISKCKEKNDRSAMAIYLMLKKAYPEMPDYTPETISEFYKAFPMVEGTQLAAILPIPTRFFRGKIAEWIQSNPAANELGLVLHTFPQFNFESLRSLTWFQYEYLAAWAELNRRKEK